jgi:peroxiredoxin
MKITVHSLALLVIVVTVSVAVALGAPPTKLEPGTKAPTFTLKDVNGKEHSLETYFNQKYVVLMWISTQCPVSNDYNERMETLQRDYAARGVTFLGINSNKAEGIDNIKEHAEKYGFSFTILKDVDNVVADLYAAQVTPEVYVIDSKGVLRYHGRIDDSRDADEVGSRDLRAALDALLAGKAVPVAETKAFGCSIKRVKKQL